MNNRNENNGNKTILIISVATFVIAIISLVVMVKTCALTEKSVEIMKDAEKLQDEKKKQNAKIIFEYANTPAEYIEAHKIYKEIFDKDSTDLTGYSMFFNKAEYRLKTFQKCDDLTKLLLKLSKELTKESKQIENIDNLLKDCENEKY